MAANRISNPSATPCGHHGLVMRVRAGLQVLYRSTSDSRFLRPLGIVCYGLSPYPVDFFQSTSIHAADERIRLDYFLDGVDYMKSVIAEWARAV